MGAGLTGLGNMILRQKQLREMEAMRALQQEKLKTPLAQQQSEIQSNVQALTMWPYLSAANKKLLIDQRTDPHFNLKWARELKAYQSQGKGTLSILEQQLFMKNAPDDTSRDMRRFFTLGGNFYSVAAPALVRGTGLRGQYMLENLDPHVPNFVRSPGQSWDRLPTIHARLKQDYDMYSAHPLYKGWVKETTRGASKALPEYRQLFNDQEWKRVSPGIFKDVGKIPRGAAAYDVGGSTKYFDFDAGKEFTPPSTAAPAMRPLIGRPTPLIKSHYDPTAPPRNVQEIPSKEVPVGRVEP